MRCIINEFVLGFLSDTSKNLPCFGPAVIRLSGNSEAGMVAQPGFFDLDKRYRALANAGDPLIRLDTFCHWGWGFKSERACLVSGGHASVRDRC